MNLKSKKKGEVYIGVLIAMGLFVMLSQAVILLANTGYELIGFTRARNAARALAAEKMEYARNLPYDSVGTVGGIPAGTITQTENISLNGQQYKVFTEVVYVDDKFDGVAPADLVPNDYKRVRIDVTWSGLGTKTVTTTITSDVAPKGVEKVTGGGTLSFLVFDSNGQPVPQANISILSSGLTPQINLNVTTADNGRIVLPGAPACTKCYRVTASKSGFSSDRTYGVSEVANPSKPDLTVTAGGLSEMSFTIDHLASLIINTFDSRLNAFAILPNQSLILQGQKTIGTTTLDVPVYKYSQNVTTNALGTLTINNLEWDNYTIQTATASAKTIGGTNPLIAFLLSPSTTLTENLTLPNKTTHSLLVAFVDSSRNPIASVAAVLKDSGVAIATVSAGLNTDPDFGQVFFDNLSSKTYTLESSVSGYQPTTTSISVSGQKYSEVTLNP